MSGTSTEELHAANERHAHHERHAAGGPREHEKQEVMA